MVMETPSPLCVGREFVRQYYTLLHECPGYLHRFYSHNSSFVHGGVEKPGEEHPPVMGQADIHKKILSLNFHDCHAKIRQVDSQATVGNAVVVQVTGELSNNGQPMRRFMQTFVLAPQTPKKYYVHNDIFRYQDEVFHDTDTEGDNLEEALDSELDMVEDGSQPETVQDPTVTSFYEPQPPPISNGNAHLGEERVESPEAQSVEDSVEALGGSAPAVPEEEEEPEAPVESTQQSSAAGQQTQPTATPAAAPVSAPAQQLPEVVETAEVTFEGTKEEEKTPEPEPQPVEQQPEAPKPFSWASILSSNKSGSNPAPVPAPVSAGIPPSQGVSAPPSGPTGMGKPQQMAAPAVGGGKNDFRPTEAGGSGPQPQRAPRPPRGDRTRERDNSRSGMDSGDDSRRSRYPDSQQLFVGNLPHTILEKELKQYFEKYGGVLEVRINRKSTRDVPNFGFVVFDNPESVQEVLDARPIMIRGEHRLNVEEKKQRADQGGRPGSGTRTGGRGPGGPGMGRGGGGPPGGLSRNPGPRSGGGGGPGGPPPDRRSDNRASMGGGNSGGGGGGGGGPRGGFGPRR